MVSVTSTEHSFLVIPGRTNEMVRIKKTCRKIMANIWLLLTVDPVGEPNNFRAEKWHYKTTAILHYIRQ